MRSFFIIAVVILLASCGRDKENLPIATGLPGNIYLVMDSAQWKGPMGKALDSILNAEMPGLPHDEAKFKMRWIDPVKLNTPLKQGRNIIFLMTLDGKGRGSSVVRKLFTPESIEKIKGTSTDFLSNSSNVFSKDQEIIYLYGKDTPTMLKNIRASGQRLIDFFDQTERARLGTAIFKTSQKGVSTMLQKDYQFDIKVPYGFQTADKQKNFIWFRQVNPKDDRNIWITRKPYSSQADFSKENLIKFRDEVCKQFLFEDPENKESYVLTETNVPFIPVTVDTVNFNGEFAVKLSGLYRSNTMHIGGPFEGFALVDQASQQFYYIEGFTYSPGVKQREIMRELETILYSFKSSSAVAKK